MSRRTRLIVVIAVLAVATLAVAVTTTPMLAVRTVTVTGADGSLNRSAESAVSATVGTPLARVDTADLRRTVLAVSPSLRDADVRRILPGTVEVTLVRREPVLRWTDRESSTTSLVDAEGAVFGRGSPAPEGTPVLVVSSELQGAERASAVADAAQALGALPDRLRAEVKAMKVETSDDIRFSLRGGRDVRWGNVDDASVKSAVLLRLLKAVPAEVYDVSAPDLPTTRSGS